MVGLILVIISGAIFMSSRLIKEQLDLTTGLIITFMSAMDFIMLTLGLKDMSMMEKTSCILIHLATYIFCRTNKNRSQLIIVTNTKTVDINLVEQTNIIEEIL